MVMQGYESVQHFECRSIGDGRFLWEAVIPEALSEEIVATLTEAYAGVDHFVVIVQDVGAVSPRPDHDDMEEEAQERVEDNAPVSVEELVEMAYAQSRTNKYFVVPVVIASFVAAAGVLKDSTILIVASMVIAPLLGPSMAFAAATTLGNIELMVHSVKTNTVGILMALLPAVVLGFFFEVNAEMGQVAPRLYMGVLDFIIAFAAGIVGALSSVVRSISSVVGVMIAVALLPPIVVSGMLVGSGDFPSAVGAGILATNNFICINLAAVVTMRLLHVKPRDSESRFSARVATIVSAALWLGSLAVMAVLLYFFPRYTSLV